MVKSSSERLRELVARLEKASASKLTRSELRELPSLYRRVASRLAEARAKNAPRDHIATLESLVIRAHSILYAPEPLRLGASLRKVVLAFPIATRRCLLHLAIATALLVIGALVGYTEVVRDPSAISVLLPGGLEENARQSFREGGAHRDGHPIYGVFYFTNNASVAFNAFALGATFGIGTILVVLFNGVILGATFAVVGMVGSKRAFFSFVSAHGGIELAAILIAAAGGLRLADGLLRPGFLTRRESFVRAGREALPLALGAALVLSVAGLTEGWLSPLKVPLVVKASVGIVLDLLLFLYLWAGSRSSSIDAPASRL